MVNQTEFTTDSFIKFITKEENRRGFVFAFKGEANTTLKSFLKGLFLFIFTRRITTSSSYDDNLIRIITNNYVDRLANGSVSKFPADIIKNAIAELKLEFDEQDKKFWSTNSTKHVSRARILQRAQCYLNALDTGQRFDDFSDGRIKPFKNDDNSIKSGFIGAIQGLFGGALSFIIGTIVIMIIFGLLALVIEFFS
jgi:hypothetical protein